MSSFCVKLHFPQDIIHQSRRKSNAFLFFPVAFQWKRGMVGERVLVYIRFVKKVDTKFRRGSRFGRMLTENEYNMSRKYIYLAVFA
jgi:hypothetical protein